MTEDLIRYDILAQDALRGVIRKVLSEVAKTGLPGNHHFFITFMTNAAGVRISSRIREKYPEQMTIVLQHQFWDLEVDETSFEVGLSFSEIPERLHIPFSAIRGFFDPSVNFELEFDVQEMEMAPEAPAAAPPPSPDVATPKAKLPVKAAEPDVQPEVDTDGKSADVVSLDSFRKKK